MNTVNIKICGLTRPEDARLAASLGAWALGFIFVPDTPRFVSPERVAEILAALEPGSRLAKVGVFRNSPPLDLVSVVERSGVTSVQLHGDETAGDCAAIRAALPDGVSVLKAVELRGAEDLDRLAGFARVCDALLLDSSSGGSGVVGDWGLAAQAVERAPAGLPMILAGGLNPGNVRAAIDRVGPFAVDVSSGLEDSPGIKSEAKMREFFRNANGGVR